jgi:DNA end-binding protein Ku
MAQSVWTGLISFGMVSIPVKLYSATESKSISFNQLHSVCKSRINQQRWCATCDRQVEYGELDKGYEVAKGQYVVVTKEELDSLPLPSKQTVNLNAFVQRDEIDAVYHDSSYMVEPDSKALRPFVLLMKALIDKGMIGIGTIAIRSKERLCALRPLDGTLMLDTLLYPDEIRVEKGKPLPDVQVTPQEEAMAASLIDLMKQDFDPTQYKDSYREALEKVITAKAEGQQLVEPDAPVTSTMPDLMEALRASVENMQSKKVVALQSVKTEEKEEKKTAKSGKSGRRAG